MNIESMRIKSYRSFAVDETPLPPAVAERLEKLDKYDDLRANGRGGAAALRHAGLSRRTLCRWKAARALNVMRRIGLVSVRLGLICAWPNFGCRNNQTRLFYRCGRAGMPGTADDRAQQGTGDAAGRGSVRGRDGPFHRPGFQGLLPVHGP